MTNNQQSPRATDLAARDATAADALYDRIDRAALQSIEINPQGGIVIANFGQMLEMAKLLSVLGIAVPPHVRGNREIALAIVMQAQQWQMDPRAVAAQSYVAKNRDVETIAYQSQLLHAVIERKAPINSRLHARYEGEGDGLICIVSATFEGEDEPREWRSPPLGKRRPRRNQDGVLKGSPLWDTKPEVQLFYDTSRDFARVYCPDVLLGLYSRDEMEEFGQAGEFPRVVNPLADAPEPRPAAGIEKAVQQAPRGNGAPAASSGAPERPIIDDGIPPALRRNGVAPVIEQPPAAEVLPPAADRPKRGRPPKTKAPTVFARGDMVALNTASPPLRVTTPVANGQPVHRGDVQQGDLGEVMSGVDEAGRYAVAWRTLPGFRVLVHGDQLLTASAKAVAADAGIDEEYEPSGPNEPEAMTKPATMIEGAATASVEQAAPPVESEADEVFPQPYIKKTAADYEVYALRWLDRALAQQTPHEDVALRWRNESKIRNGLGLGFEMAEWREMQKKFYAVLDKLQPPIE